MGRRCGRSTGPAAAGASLLKNLLAGFRTSEWQPAWNVLAVASGTCPPPEEFSSGALHPRHPLRSLHAADRSRGSLLFGHLNVLWCLPCRRSRGLVGDVEGAQRVALEWKGPLECFLAAGKCQLPQPTFAEPVVVRMSRTPPENISGEGVHVSDRTRCATGASPLFERSNHAIKR